MEAAKYAMSPWGRRSEITRMRQAWPSTALGSASRAHQLRIARHKELQLKRNSVTVRATQAFETTHRAQSELRRKAAHTLQFMQSLAQETHELTQKMHFAAVKIQALVRGHLVRVHNEQLFLQTHTQVLSSTLDSLQVDLQDMRLTLGETVQAAAVRIQKVYRAYRVRKATKLMLVQSKMYWNRVREGVAGVVQAWFRAQIAREVLKARVEEVKREEKLKIIRRKLAFITIKRLMHAPLLAFRVKKMKIVKKRQRKMARLDAISRLKSETLPAIQPASAQVPLSEANLALPELNSVPEPLLSEVSEVAVYLQPLGRAKGRLSLPTVAFLQHSADTVAQRPVPKSRPQTKAAHSRRSQRSRGSARRPGGYLLSTQSSLYRCERSSEEPLYANRPSKPPSTSVQKPTEAWLRFSTLRQDLRLELTGRPKEPLWRYATRASGLETLPSTPFTDLRGSVSPGPSRLNTARMPGRRLLSSEMVRPEDQPDSRLHYARLSLSTLS